MKKVLALITAVTILFGTTAFAEQETDGMQEVLAQVLQRIPETSEFEKFDAESLSYDGVPSYDFSWYFEGDNSTYMHVSATADAVITDYYYYVEGNEEDENRITRDQAYDKAAALVKRLNPALEEELIVEKSTDYDNPYATAYRFDVVRKKNGIPIYGDSGRVRVWAYGEGLQSFSLSRTENGSFPYGEVISEQSAREAFKQEIGVKPIYKTYYDGTAKKTTAFAAYAFKDNDEYINALSGEKVIVKKDAVFYAGYNDARKESSATADSGGGGFSAAEESELKAVEKLISAESIEKSLRQNALLALGGYTVQSNNLRKTTNNETVRYIRSITFKKEAKGNKEYAYASVYADNGELVSFGRERSSDTQNAGENAVRSAAEKAVAALAPQKGTQYREAFVSDTYAVYQRYVNEIAVDGDEIRIEFGGKNARLDSFFITYTDTTFPDISGMINIGAAADALLDEAGYEPIYLPTVSDNEKTEYSICYAPVIDNVLINAETGKRVNYDGSVYKTDKTADYVDIENHYACEAVRTLREYNIGFADAYFKPDEPVSQKEFLALLMSTVRGNELVIDEDTDYERFYQTARNVIRRNEAFPEETVSRANAAKYICRALNIDRCGETDEIYACPFADVSDGKGYITLLYGLGIISGGDTGEYCPNDALLRGDLAILLKRITDNASVVRG